ncbi:MAG: hypothetical protein JXA10_01380 [Anaerolineae bacterium]|nr:hypothetical protein [Anaerolineae bacterium]
MKKKLSFLAIVGLIVTMLGSVVGVSAQGPGEGGIIFDYDLSDPTDFNPLISGDVTSSNVWSKMYPNVFGVDSATGAYAPGYKDSLAVSWEFDETGTVLTVKLREDAFWTDGVQITSKDFIWMLEALRSGLLDTQRGGETWETLDDGTPGSGLLVDAVAIDDFTVELTFSRADCNSLNEIFATVVPSHIFEEDFGDDLAAMNDDPLYDPGVYFGSFVAPDFVPGDRVSMIANQDYIDAELGYVSPSEWVTLNIPDQDVAVERFRAGELTYMGIPATYQSEFEDDPNFQTYRFPRRGYVFYAFNHANPDNPQAAYDEEGNYIEQEPHPVLGDKLVRQAIVMSVDMDAIIENNLDGNAVRVGVGTIPSSWDYDPDQLYPFDPVAAAEMLDEAGWVMGDGDYRVCQGCAYAAIDPDYEGTEMALMLNDSTGGTEQSKLMVEFIAQSMRDIGINAEVQELDWGSAFLPELTGQTFDMAILAWSLGLPLDPDSTSIFSREVDVPGSGFNFGSFHNAEIEQLYKDARDPAKTNNCSLEGRLPYYQRANEIIFDELPYMFMYANLSMSAAHSWVEGWDPVVFSTTWNADSWTAIAPVE